MKKYKPLFACTAALIIPNTAAGICAQRSNQFDCSVFNNYNVNEPLKGNINDLSSMPYSQTVFTSASAFGSIPDYLQNK